PTYENLEYDETFKEVWIYTYPYGKVLNPYFQQFFDNENRTIMIFPNNSSNSENELLFQQFEKPISLSDFLSIETK
ncbi:MAG: hypothetical protein LBH55_04330, partial [Mycoplasmataceae bacterium]|nr:hypothetical protein [Mycoplasmataceae bacterium]